MAKSAFSKVPTTRWGTSSRGLAHQIAAEERAGGDLLVLQKSHHIDAIIPLPGRTAIGKEPTRV